MIDLLRESERFSAVIKNERTFFIRETAAKNFLSDGTANEIPGFN
jgi:hypothetical protein